MITASSHYELIKCPGVSPKMYYFQKYVVIPITAYIMWNGLVLLRHWSMTSGKLVFLFLGLISMWALANNEIYRPIETYMRNSTSLISPITIFEVPWMSQ